MKKNWLLNLIILAVLIFTSLQPVSAGIELVFNDPPNPNGIEDKVISFISGATSTLDIAIYNFTNQKIYNSVIAAKNRGVKVRVVTEADNWNTVMTNLVNQGIPVVKDTDGGAGAGLMHNKFVIRDKKDILTGSYNFTYPQTDEDKNTLLIMTSASGAASIYTTEFNQMFVDKKFGTHKQAATVYSTKVGTTQIEIYFAPKSQVIDKITAAIATCNYNIWFDIFTFTSQPIADAILNQKKLGRTVKGIFDLVQAGSQYCKHTYLAQAGCEIRTDNYTGLLHEKNMTIDAGTSSSPIAIIGSFNYTDTANTSNDENIVFIHSGTVATALKNNISNVFNKSTVVK